MYNRTIWKDHVEGVQEGTDLNAENFNNIEAGIMESNALAALNAHYHRYAIDVAKNHSQYQTFVDIINGESVLVNFPENYKRNHGDYIVVRDITNVYPADANPGVISIKNNFAESFLVTTIGTTAEKVSIKLTVIGGMT